MREGADAQLDDGKEWMRAGPAMRSDDQQDQKMCSILRTHLATLSRRQDAELTSSPRSPLLPPDLLVGPLHVFLVAPARLTGRNAMVRFDACTAGEVISLTT